jgi:hypothetical protein
MESTQTLMQQQAQKSTQAGNSKSLMEQEIHRIAAVILSLVFRRRKH